jgi:hypothetical protein
MEIRWYWLADVNWNNFGLREAEWYIKAVDYLFGSSLLSAKRIIFSILLVFIIASILLSVLPVNVPVWLLGANSYRFYTALIACVISFTLSISLTHYMASLATRLMRDGGVVKNLALFLLFLIVSYCVILLFVPIFSVLRTIVFNIIATFEQYFFSNRGAFWAAIDTQIWLLNYNLKHVYTDILNFDLFFSSYLNGWVMKSPISVHELQVFIVNSIGSGLRVIFTVGFLLSILLSLLMRGPILLIWARLVESEKPIFTMLFGGLAALGKGLQAIVS